ncbi:hypothetical protein SDC9_73404 [bioreactor metagenome]|uniref:HpcH/HpaI aldolase/citrate lyase domain-containing protein n=1 Tax=bioreactor metagenome TaxID=1076179 RepID=A0A644YEZ0_9ZZZZ
MQIQPYQFIKYNKDTQFSHIERASKTGAVLCFDFEDGIVHPFDSEMTGRMKEEAREQFNRLYRLITDSGKNISIGVRINNNKTSYFEKDLIAIQNKKIDTILVPKTEHPDDVESTINSLDSFGIEYDSFVPVIETKAGLGNLEEIVGRNNRIKKIAFGHCDYNLSIGAYPFFHQDSWQYWKWISAIISVIGRYGIQLINSPYLNFSNEQFFCSMLEYISSGNNRCHGQVTLTNRQSELCKSEKGSSARFKFLLENKNLIPADRKVAVDMVREFENNNLTKGLSKSGNRFISLQEYIASKQLSEDPRETKEMFFIGGCFPVQHNILFEDLFHSKLKQKAEKASGFRLNISIIRYERLCDVLKKTKETAQSGKPGLIVFHVRPEPYLRIVKLFYKYRNNSGKVKWSVNLPMFRYLNPEKYDMLTLQGFSDINTRRRNPVFHKMLVTMNYLFGKMIGNKQFAMKSYYRTAQSFIGFCNENNIEYIILGPNRRNNTQPEPALCRDLDRYFSCRTEGNNYVSGYVNDGVEKMNFENGIHVTREYHDLIAEKLFNVISENKYWMAK